MVGWPSGLRRQFKALVSSEARVRIPLQSFLLFALAKLLVSLVKPLEHRCHETLQLAIAVVAQLGERQTEDLKVPGSIPGDGTECFVFPEAPHSDLKRWFVHIKLLCFDSFCIVK